MHSGVLKRTFSVFLAVLLLSSCNGWVIQPLPGNPPTPFLPFTPTPSIITQTPVIIGAASATFTPGVVTSVPTDTPAPTLTEITSTPLELVTATGESNGTAAITVKVLGCNTSIDVTHGMGEVTNAFVTLMNTGTLDLTHIKVTLNALDEGRVHPDKTVELSSLPISYQVTIKLTVDTTYKQDTPIQVSTVSDQGSFPIEGLPSCREIGLFAPKPESLKTPVPVAP